MIGTATIHGTARETLTTSPAVSFHVQPLLLLLRLRLLLRLLLRLRLRLLLRLILNVDPVHIHLKYTGLLDFRTVERHSLPLYNQGHNQNH